MLILKSKAACQLGLRRRSESLTPHDHIIIVEKKKILCWLLSKRRKLLLEEATISNMDSISNLSGRIEAVYCNLQAYLTVERVIIQNEHKNKTISMFSSDWIYSSTRFHSAADLLRLYTALGLPARIVLDNGSVISGEEALLVTLYRLSFPRRLSDTEETFGREYSHWSRVTLKWIVKHWWYLLSDNINYWTKQIPSFHQSVVSKIVELFFTCA